MRGVDLGRTPFDFDLTFAALLMHPDGHVYHRYGARDARSADRWLDEASFADTLRAALDAHDAYGLDPHPPAPRPRRVIEEIPAFRKRDKGQCIHCHSVFPAFYEEARDAGAWTEDARWVYPPPSRIGLDLARDDQTRITRVAAGSSASAAGLVAGDRLLRVGDAAVRTVSDLSQALHDASPAAQGLRVAFERGGEERTVSLALADGWKRGTPREFAWRPFKWGFTPAPGFGGTALTDAERAAAGIALDAFAVRVTYLVTWGDNARYGRAAASVGLREGDVLLAADGKRDFDSEAHFHAWWRLTRKPGDTVPVEVRRGEATLTLEITVLP